MVEVAPDGSPVAFYRRIPATGEPELIHSTVRPGGSILDIGCGTGRIAGPLAELGHPVAGIDNSPEMIAALPPTVEGLVADAATVRLGRTFDCALLASHFVNESALGRAFAATARAHVGPAGVVIGEAYPPDWGPEAALGRTSRLGDAEVTLVRAVRTGDQLEAEVRYAVDGRVWKQPFTARLLDEAALTELLAGAGLRFERWLERSGWFLATRVG
jgi:SAM-dependent methyltransferase